MALAEGGIGWVPYFLEKADFVYDHHRAWTGADFGDKLPEPGVPGARADVLHRRRDRAAQPSPDRRRHHHVGVRLPALRLDVAEVARDADEVARAPPSCPTTRSTWSRGRTPAAGTSSTRSSTAPVRSAPWARCGRRRSTSTPRPASTAGSTSVTTSPSTAATRRASSSATTQQPRPRGLTAPLLHSLAPPLRPTLRPWPPGPRRSDQVGRRWTSVTVSESKTTSPRWLVRRPVVITIPAVGRLPRLALVGDLGVEAQDVAREHRVGELVRDAHHRERGVVPVGLPGAHDHQGVDRGREATRWR